MKSRRRVNSTVGPLILPMKDIWKPNAVVIAGLILLTLSELFPPWVYEDENTSGVRSAGYHFYKSPPAVKSAAEMKKIFNYRDGESTQFMWVHRDSLQIDAQRVVLAWLFFNGLILSFGRGSLLIRVLFGIFFGVGVVAAIALIYWGV
jgi:hypothetical protein